MLKLKLILITIFSLSLVLPTNVSAGSSNLCEAGGAGLYLEQCRETQNMNNEMAYDMCTTAAALLGAKRPVLGAAGYVGCQAARWHNNGRTESICINNIINFRLQHCNLYGVK